MNHRMIGFIDGENLVLRYQAMVAEGRVPQHQVIHTKDVFVWHPAITEQYFHDVIRLSFYQTVVGDDPHQDAVHEAVAALRYTYSPAPMSAVGTGTLRPRLFKKESRSAKTKSVDINLTVDMLRHAADPQLDILLLVSGDGDYLPLVEEVSKRGKQVWVAALSSGLNKKLRYMADQFVDLDRIFFLPPVPQALAQVPPVPPVAPAAPVQPAN